MPLRTARRQALFKQDYHLSYNNNKKNVYSEKESQKSIDEKVGMCCLFEILSTAYHSLSSQFLLDNNLKHPIWWSLSVCYLFCFVGLLFSSWKSHLRGHFSTKGSLKLKPLLAFEVNFPQFDVASFGFPSHRLIHSFLGHAVSTSSNDVSFSPGSFWCLIFILLLLLVINLINWLIQIQMPSNCISLCGPYRTSSLSKLFPVFNPNFQSNGNDGSKSEYFLFIWSNNGQARKKIQAFTTIFVV